MDYLNLNLDIPTILNFVAFGMVYIAAIYGKRQQQTLKQLHSENVKLKLKLSEIQLKQYAESTKEKYDD